MILNDVNLAQIKLKSDGGRVPHGYPVSTINDLLDTIYFLKKEKKKWQHLAEKRGRGLGDIQDIIIKTAALMDEHAQV